MRTKDESAQQWDDAPCCAPIVFSSAYANGSAGQSACAICYRVDLTYFTRLILGLTYSPLTNAIRSLLSFGVERRCGLRLTYRRSPCRCNWICFGRARLITVERGDAVA